MSEWEVKPLPIIGQYNVQRFTQFCPEDSANFYVVTGQDTKKPFVMYPTFGRQHINYAGLNRLQFPVESRCMFRSKNFWYNVSGNTIYQIDKNFNQLPISNGLLQTITGNVFYAVLVVNRETFVCFVDGQKVYIYREVAGTFDVVTDPNAPGNLMQDGVLTKPGFIVAFGNRIAVSVAGSSQFFLAQVNLGGSAFNPATCFTINGAAVFAQESGVIGQMGVLNNTLYIYCDFTTGVWSNIPAIFSGTGVQFPWKKNTTYDWNVGIADPLSLAINFGRMVFLGQNSDGLLQVMGSEGGEPKPIDNQAIDVLFQDYANNPETNSPFLEGDANGFLMQYENAVLYRISAGLYRGEKLLDDTQDANSLEYHYGSKTWHRCIEVNGERNRVQKHVFFNNRHLVSIQGEGTIYELSGRFYTNEELNPDIIPLLPLNPDPNGEFYYVQYPMRYERISPIIFQDDYSEIETEYVQIDFVFGDSNISYSTNPFPNAQFIIDEQDVSGEHQFVVTETPAANNEPIFMIAEQGNFPVLTDLTYNALYKPNIQLYYSDDGGISFLLADDLRFSDQGNYQWRMRWYQLGSSRNRCYKLVAVSPVPIVILGGTMKVRRSSGGAD